MTISGRTRDDTKKLCNIYHIDAIARSMSTRCRVLVVVAILLSFVDAGGTQDTHHDERQLSNKVRAFGANPIDRYPLARCQGDCDLDSQCRGRMICFQRTRYEPVPGCEGGRQDRTPSDYCVDPFDLTVSPQLNFLGMNPSRQDFPLQGAF
jgi:hypothetical protein